jgi:hypothetical protein
LTEIYKDLQRLSDNGKHSSILQFEEKFMAFDQALCKLFSKLNDFRLFTDNGIWAQNSNSLSLSIPPSSLSLTHFLSFSLSLSYRISFSLSLSLSLNRYHSLCLSFSLTLSLRTCINVLQIYR